MMEISPTHSPIRPLPVRVIPVLRPQHHQHEYEHPISRKMTRPKSPSQKIPRNHSSRSIDIPSSNEYEMDENGKPDMTGHTCFSYRTMQKQYEKDTQRMLERIQKSRSFETSQTNLQQHDQTPRNDIAQRSVSLMDLASIADEASRNCYYDGGYDDGFYIGDEGYDDDHNVGGSCLDHLRQMNQHFEDDQDEIFELDL